jgi:hypothetical protein
VFSSFCGRTNCFIGLGGAPPFFRTIEGACERRIFAATEERCLWVTLDDSSTKGRGSFCLLNSRWA